MHNNQSNAMLTHSILATYRPLAQRIRRSSSALLGQITELWWSLLNGKDYNQYTLAFMLYDVPFRRWLLRTPPFVNCCPTAISQPGTGRLQTSHAASHSTPKITRRGDITTVRGDDFLTGSRQLPPRALMHNPRGSPDVSACCRTRLRDPHGKGHAVRSDV